MMTSAKISAYVLYPLLAIILISAYLPQLYLEQMNLLYTDFGRIYQSTIFFLHHQNIYAQLYAVELSSSNHTLQTKVMPGNLNTPFFQLLLTPLGFFTYAQALVMWSLFSLGCALGSIYLIFECLQLKPQSFLYCGSALALFAFFPTFANFQFGQVVFPILLLLCIAWKLLQNKQTKLAAVVLAIAGCCKPFLLLNAFLFLLRREWNGLIYYFSTLIICFVLSFLVFGIANLTDYNYILQHIHWYSSNWNASLLGFFVRLFGSTYENNTPSYYAPHLTWPCYYLSGIAIFIYANFCIFRNAKLYKQYNLDYAIILVLGLLTSPLGWLYYFPLLIIPFSVLLQLAFKQKISLLNYLLTCVAILLSSIPYPLKITKAVQSAGIIWFWSGSYFYALLLLLFLCINVAKSITNSRTIPNDLNSNYQYALLISTLLPSFLGIIMATQSLLIHKDVYLPHIQQIYWKNSRVNNA